MVQKEEKKKHVFRMQGTGPAPGLQELLTIAETLTAQLASPQSKPVNSLFSLVGRVQVVSWSQSAEGDWRSTPK